MDNDELIGRIQGLADFVLSLTAQLEINGIIDGPVFTERLNARAQTLNITDRPQCTATTRRMLSDLAEQLDDMRAVRQERDS